MKSFFAFYLKFLAIVVLCVAAGSYTSASAQLTTAEEKGLPPNSVFHLGDVDAINLQNGNLHISIPIMSSEQRGGTTLAWNLVYDTPLWFKKWVPNYCPQTVPKDIIIYDDPKLNPLPELPCPPAGVFAVGGADQTTGWRLTNPNQWTIGSTSHIDNCPIAVSGPPTIDHYNEWYLYNYDTNYQFYDAQGTAHPLALRTENYNAGGHLQNDAPCLGSTMQSPTLDGSGTLVQLGAGFPYSSGSDSIFNNDGTELQSLSNEFSDRNGNLFSASADTLGRNDVAVTYDPNYPVPTSGGQPTHQIYTVHDSNGNPQQYLVDFEPIDFTSSACPQSGLDGVSSGPTSGEGYTCTETGGAEDELHQLTLPNGKTYTFTYNANSPGELAVITLPTGATISFTYTDYYQVAYSSVKLQPNSVIGGRAVASRTVAFDGRSYKWTYNPQLFSNTVTDPDGNVQTHQFSQLTVPVGSTAYTSTSQYETQVTYANSQGNVLRTVQTTYAADFGPMDSLVVNARPVKTTTTLDNGLVSQKQTDYESFSYTCNPCQGGGGVATRLNPTEVREYDYGTGSPGPLLRRTDYTYLHNNNAAYVPLNIVDKPATITTYDGLGNQLAQTTYEYDIYSRTTQPMQASGAIRHNVNFGTSYQTRGNPTAVSQWLNTTNSLLTTTSQYDDAGNLLSKIDPRGNRTSYSYNDVWSNGSCAPSDGPAKAYPTLITNALNATVSNQYNSCTGTIAASTDENGNTSSITYDSLNRPVHISFPDGGAKTYCYSDNPNGNCSSSLLSMISTTALNSQTNVKTTVLYDGLGQAKQSQANSDPSGIVYADSVTNDRGQLVSSSNPYRTSIDPTSGTTTYTYDALGRKLVQTNPDKSTVSYSYSGNVTTITDENGNTWQRTEDGLGRLTKVMEPDPVTGVPDLETDYTYDGLGNLRTVNQLGVKGMDTPKTRSFTYDSLSRLITSSNPETGLICYGQWSGGSVGLGTCKNSYDENGNLRYKTDARGIATSYIYDVLNRLTEKTYSDGTPTVTLSYDQTGVWGAAACGTVGFSQCNTVGRLSAISTGQVSGLASSASSAIFSYDAMGRIVLKSTCIASLCGSDRIDQYFTYDLAGNETGYDHGTDIGKSSYYGGHVLGYDSAARLQSLTYLPAKTAAPSTLFTATKYGPVGLLESGLGNGLSEVRSYDVRLRQQSYNVVNSSQTNSAASFSGSVDFWENNDVVRFPHQSISGSSLPENGEVYVTGWVGTIASCPVGSVQIYIDQTPIGAAVLGVARPDVQQIVYNNDGLHTNCGYSFLGSIGATAAGTHTISVHVTDSSGNAWVIPMGQSTMTVTSDPPPSGNIDGALPGATSIVAGGLLNVGGWAIDSQMHAPVGSVKILIDGIPIGYANLGISRLDVASAFGDPRYNNSGWSFSGGIGGTAPGSHTVSAIVYDTGGQSYKMTTPISVVADAAPAYGYLDSGVNNTTQTNVVPMGGTVLVKGWAGEYWNTSACASSVSRVDVLLDGNYLGQAQLGLSYPGVASAFQNPSCMNSGWSFTGTISNVDPGTHVLSARAYDPTGGSVLLQYDSGVTAVEIQVNAQLSPASVATSLPTQYAWSLGFGLNGNVSYSSDSVNGEYAYLYDHINRLSASGSNTNGLQWTYDSFGNRTAQTITDGSGVSQYQTFTLSASNRSDDLSYDAAGNTLSNGGVFPIPLTWDAEERLSSAGSTQYVYDAMGQRAAKYVDGALSEAYLYDNTGHIVTELNGSFAVDRREIYAGGRHLGTLDQKNNLTYVFADWLGTERARANSSGNLCQTSTSQPYGDNQATSGTCFPSPVFFTGKERDAESGLDYFGARYYASNMGRFMSPDWASKPSPVPYSSLTDPQTLNLYQYMQNNPLGGTDKDGHCGQQASGQKSGPTDCSQVKVTATPATQPAPIKTVSVKGNDGKVHTETGPIVQIHMTVTVNGAGVDGVHITESNQSTTTVKFPDGSQQTNTQTPVQNSAISSSNSGSPGGYTDTVGPGLPVEKVSPAEATKDYGLVTAKDVDVQTQTLTFPNGCTCTATSTRTTASTGPGSGYTTTTTQPVVSPAPPQQ